MEAILSNSSRKLLRFETTKMLIAVWEKNFIVSFIIIFGTLSFPIDIDTDTMSQMATSSRHLQASVLTPRVTLPLRISTPTPPPTFCGMGN